MLHSLKAMYTSIVLKCIFSDSRKARECSIRRCHIDRTNRQFQLLVYACRGGGGGVRYHIADYAEKIKMVAV